MTEDGGAKWADSGAGLGATIIRSLVIDPQNPRIMYAGTDRGIFRSESGGKNWFSFNDGLRDAPPPPASGRLHRVRILKEESLVTIHVRLHLPG